MILKQRSAYECVTAKDGLDAISRAVVEAPDLVLTDVVMPRMKGFEVRKRMRLEQSAKTLSSSMETAAMRESPSKLYWEYARQSSRARRDYAVPPSSITAAWP